MKHYELTINANNDVPVCVRVNKKRSVFFGTKTFLLKSSSNVELCEVSDTTKFSVLLNHQIKHLKKFEMPSSNLKLYVSSERNLQHYDLSNYFLLKEVGSRAVMLKCFLTPDSVIEKLGKNKIRIYISENLKMGKLNFSSPAYFIANRAFATYTQYKGIQIAYNTKNEKKIVNQTSFFEKSFEIKSSYFDNDDLILVTNENLPTHKKEISVYISKCSLVQLNGMQNLEILSPNLLKVKNFELVEIQKKVNVNLTGSFYFVGGTKIYCDISNFKINDTIVFDYSTGNGKSYSISNILKDNQGFYLLISEFIESKPKFICKSHTQELYNEIVNFSYENKTAYYTVSGTDMTKDLVWLTHKPDTIKGGRANHTLSYVDCYFEYEELEYIMRNSNEDTNN